MTDFPTLLRAAGVSIPWLSRATGHPLGSVKCWAAGRYAAPANIVAWLERRAADQPPFRAAPEPSATLRATPQP